MSAEAVAWGVIYALCAGAVLFAVWLWVGLLRDAGAPPAFWVFSVAAIALVAWAAVTVGGAA